MKEAVLKTVVAQATVGSNPTPSAISCRRLGFAVRHRAAPTSGRSSPSPGRTAAARTPSNATASTLRLEAAPALFLQAGMVVPLAREYEQRGVIA